jgi:hypothetical protein
MSYTTILEEFLKEQEKRLQSYYNSNRIKLEGFEKKERFIEWYLHELYINENKCHYCKTSILNIRDLINKNIVAGRSVKGGGMRGHNLEIDRMNAGNEYSESNCVLSCYYCNNDKSNTFNYDIYKNIIGPGRKMIWDQLLAGIK